MAEATAQELEALEPFIAGANPDHRGEIEFYCPLHSDTRRSASMNVQKGVWCCHAGCGGGSIRQLVNNDGAWVPADGRVQEVRPSATSPIDIPVTMRDIAHWHNRLRREPRALTHLMDERGLQYETLRRALIGWDGRVFKIPVFGPDRCLWNVRNYDPNPAPGRSKIWNTRGMGQARLYPYNMLHKAGLHEPILWCEGEWDTLLAIQHGYTAVTRTDGAGKPWHEEWTEEFVGHRTYLCNDVDDTGEQANATVEEGISDVAMVYQCHLPFRHKKNGGSDLSDYILMFRPDQRDVMLADLIDTATRKV